MSYLKFLKSRNAIIIGVAVVAVIVIGVLIYTDSNHNITLPSIFGSSDKQIAENTIKYINDNKLAQSIATLESYSVESGLVKVKIKIGSSSFDSYVTKDGKLLFPQVIDMKPKKADNADTGSTETKSTELVKVDKPVLDAFVVSRCPYGLQMQRMMADAIESVPALSEYLKARYIGEVSGNTITAMHGEAEAQENLRQICIREEQPAKYWSYVACQMKKGDTKGCETSTGVDSTKLASCISNPAKGVAYAKIDFDLANKNNVSGSPTLILGDAQVSEFDFGGRTSDAMKSIICAASKTPPSFCSTKLNTADAAASFSETYASASGSNTSSGAGCEAAQ